MITFMHITTAKARFAIPVALLCIASTSSAQSLSENLDRRNQVLTHLQSATPNELDIVSNQRNGTIRSLSGPIQSDQTGTAANAVERFVDNFGEVIGVNSPGIGVNYSNARSSFPGAVAIDAHFTYYGLPVRGAGYTFSIFRRPDLSEGAPSADGKRIVFLGGENNRPTDVADNWVLTSILGQSFPDIMESRTPILNADQVLKIVSGKWESFTSTGDPSLAYSFAGQYGAKTSVLVYVVNGTIDQSTPIEIEIDAIDGSVVDFSYTRAGIQGENILSVSNSTSQPNASYGGEPQVNRNASQVVTEKGTVYKIHD